MNLFQFLRRFVFHLAVASFVLSILLLIAEWLVPGSVLPFVDLIDLLPVTVGLVLTAAVLMSSDNCVDIA